MDISSLEVLKGLVAYNNPETPQVMQVSVSTTDIHSNVAELKWYNVDANGAVDDPFATAHLFFGEPSEWLASWVPMTHLVQGRIRDLERLAEAGIANRFSHNMAYLLFGNNLVDYASKYRGMRNVVLHELEAFADIELTTEKSGTYTVPPYFIDSVCHLSGFVMNCSDAIDTKANYCVTPGWRSLRITQPLVAGAKYRSYVKMIPTAADPTVYLGDVYILQNDVIVGMMGGHQFRRYPRILLSRFFSAPDDSKAPPVASAQPVKTAAAAAAAAPSKKAEAPKPAPQPAAPVAKPTPAPAIEAAAKKNVDDIDEETTTAKAIHIIADEAALDLADLTNDASFGDLGIDSLMSLVIAEKFREQLNVVVSGSLFLEYPTIGDLRSWLEEYYN